MREKYFHIKIVTNFELLSTLMEINSFMPIIERQIVLKN